MQVAPVSTHRSRQVFRWGFLLLGVGLVPLSCYNPNYAQSGYQCQTDMDCPNTLVCINKVCLPPGRTSNEADAGSTDLSGGAADLSAGHDLATGHDLMTTPADMKTSQPDMANPNCPVGGGVPVGKPGNAGSDVDMVYACKGNFAKGQYASLCGTGLHPCNDQMDNDLLSNMDMTACGKAGGFYAADIDAGYRLTTGQFVCETVFVPSPAALPGCGTEADVVSVGDGASCLNFPTDFRCDKTGGSWNCNGASSNILASSSHSDPSSMGGILCCK